VLNSAPEIENETDLKVVYLNARHDGFDIGHRDIAEGEIEGLSYDYK
jgi:hypothetical protein